MKHIVKAFTDLHIWLKVHPVKSILFTFLMTVMASMYGEREDWGGVIIPLMAGLMVLMFTFMLRSKPMIIAVLCVSLITPMATKAQERKPDGEGGGCVAVVVGAVVVIVGVVVVIKLRKFCQKHFPRTDTNAPPSLMFEGSGGGPEYDAAALNWAEAGSCSSDDQCGDGAGGGSPGGVPQYTTISLALRIDDTEQPGEITLTPVVMKASTGSRVTQSWSELDREARKLGVEITASGNHFSYSHNGVPVEQSPISWNNGVVRISRGSKRYYTVIVERSRDMVQWTPALTVQTEVGSVIAMEDTNRGEQQFYRYGAFLSD